MISSGETPRTATPEQPPPRSSPIRGSLASPNLRYRRVKEEVQEPICRDPGPVLGALQLEEVSRPPEEGGRKSPELHAHDVVNRELAPQLNQLAHGLVLERLQLILSPVDNGEDVLFQRLALLNRRLGVGRDLPPHFFPVWR